LSHRLQDRGYNVIPIIFPGVAENQARLRFFLTCRHSPEQIDGVLDAVSAELPEVLRLPSFVEAIAGKTAR
jgi:7-keto-8-aminopelargonate synthetase-like enzyme